MRKLYVLFFSLISFIAITTTTQAQVTGIKTVPGDYPSLAAAISALNSGGVGAGGATISIAGGYTETAPVGGFVLGSATLNASLSVANPLIIQKAGGANPVFSAPVGTSTTVDGIFFLAGVDYVTINGISLLDGNTGSPASMEFGFALVNRNSAAPFDGCQNITIQNCTITMNRLNPNGAFGIYSSHHVVANNTGLAITATSDAHSNNKFYSNTITNSNQGFWILGYAAASPYTLYDQNNDVGGSSAATGNIITNLGGNSSFNLFGISVQNQNGANVSYNTFDNAGGGGVGNTTQTIAVYASGTNSTFTATNNNITLTQASGTAIVAGIYGAVTGTGANNLNNNSVTFSDASGSGTHYGIYSSSAGTVNINTNTFNANNSGSVTSTFYFCYAATTAAGGETINGNNYNNINLSTTGTVYLIYKSNSTTNSNITNNTVTSFSKTGSGGTVYGFYNFGVPGGGTQNFSNNNFSNFSLTGATTFYGVYMATNTTETQVVNNNTISNVSVAGGTSTVYGIYFSYGSTGNQINGNTISNITNGGTIYGIQIGGTASTDLQINGNNINNLTGTGTGSVNGLYVTSGNANTILKNKIYNIANNNASGTAYGIYITAGTSTIHNNLVGHITAPASTNTNAVSGLYFSGGTTINAYYNTVYLTGTSTGTGFGTSAIYASTTPTVRLNNNIFYNNSFPTGTGRAVAYRRSSTTLTTYDNASNNNLWYAATGANNGIYFDGTNFDQTLAAFQTRVAPRDAASKTELSTPFVSLLGSDPNYLHISISTPTVAESGGAPVGGITIDYDNDTRNATTPDIGADEFAGTAPTTCTGTPIAGSITGQGFVCSGSSTILNLTGFTNAPGISLQWQSSTTSGGPYSNIAGATGASYNTGALAVTTYYVVVVSCSGGGSATTAQFAVSPATTPTITTNPASPSLCPGSGGVSITASGASTYTWSPAAGLSATTGATVVANPAATTTYTITGVSAQGCVGTTNVTVTLNPTVGVTVAPATPAICTGGSTNLTATGTSSSGYTITSITYAPVATPGSGVTTLSSGGTASTPLSAGNLDDGGWAAQNIGFTFNFYGTAYTQFAVSTNGFIFLGGGAPNTYTGYNTAFPSATPAHPSIGATYSDLDFRTAGTINYFVTGTAPNRQLVVNWSAGQFYSGTGAITTQAILYEGTDIIEVHITNSTGNNAAVEGIQNAAGTSASVVTGRNAVTWAVTTPDAYRWSPAAFNYTWFPSTSLNTTTGNVVTANPTTTTTYMVRATQTSTGCSATGTATVLVHQVPAPLISPTNPVICNGSVQQLTATSNSTAATTTATSGTISVAIPDNNVAGANNTITVSGIPANAVITNMQVVYNINHTYDGDLIVNLKAPNGNVLNLVKNRGGSGDNFISTAVSSAPGLPSISSGTAPFTGVYSPDAQNLVGPTGYSSNVVNFTGLYSVPNGSWTIAMQDNASQDVGTLTSWTLNIHYLVQDNITWSPTTGLYTNAGASTPYTGTNLQTVYAKPTTTTTYTATASTAAGCATGTANVIVTVNQPPSVTTQPTNLALCTGNTAVFTVTAAGAGLTYQWFFNGNPLSNGGNVSGATSTTLTIANITSANAGNYTVQVSGTCTPSPATSAVATLAVDAPPLISSQPQSQTACGGNTVSFSVGSAGINTYQWYKGTTPLVTDGVHIFGATTATLTIVNVTAADAGNYSVVVTNSCGYQSTSAVAVLTFSTNDRWLGVANSDWNNPNNWCGGVPTATTDVEIPSGTLFPAILASNGDVRNLQINAGATFTVASGGWLNIWGSTLTQNGTFNTSLATIAFRNTANLNIPAMTIANVVMNGTGGITLTGNLRVDTALTLTSGNITLGSNNLTMRGGTIGSVSSHVITNGTGAVINTNVGVATVVFPVAPNATSYNPVQIADGGGLNYTVRVATGITPAITNPAIAINRTWTIIPSAAPTSPVSLTFGYADADANGSYNAATRMEAGYYSGTAWTITTGNGGTAAMGTSTARLVYTTSQNFGTGAWVVSNIGGITGIVTGTPNLNSDIYSARLLPNIVDNQAILRVMSRRAMNVEWMVTDIQGRVVMKFNKPILAGQNDINVKLGQLASGTYQIVGYTDKGTTNVVPFVRL